MCQVWVILKIRVLDVQRSEQSEQNQQPAADKDSQIPRSKQRQGAEDESTDGWMCLVLSVASKFKSLSACLQQSGGTQMSCAGNVWTRCKTKDCAAHALKEDVFCLDHPSRSLCTLW